jgi:predicted nucleic acid-binding protein
LESTEGVIDVSILIPTTFNNPLREEAVEFVAEILSGRRLIIPVPTLIGAYHIATRYLRVPCLTVKKILEGILRTRSPALYPHLTVDLALDSLDYAAHYGIESWDGFLIALSRSLGTRIIYTLDEELRKVKEVSVVNPFPEEKVAEYHRWIKERLAR